MSTEIVIPAEHKKALQAAANKTAAATPKTPNALVTFFVSVFLPLLPGLLLAAAPKVLANQKLLTVLRETDKVIDGILGQDTSE